MYLQMRSFLVRVAVYFTLLPWGTTCPATSLEWTRQFGTQAEDSSKGISADHMGNVYVTGYTAGGLGGPNAGSRDAFVSKYDSDGALQWVRQIGTSSSDEGIGVSADGQGSVYVTGLWNRTDAFVGKYSAEGDLQWTRILGNTGGQGVSADGLGNVYVSGYTGYFLGGPDERNIDAFLSKYDENGTLQWMRQLASDDLDLSTSVSADGLGNVYIAGGTHGSLGGCRRQDLATRL